MEQEFDTLEMDTAEFARFVEVIRDKKYNAEAIVLEMMKTNPSYFMDLYDTVAPKIVKSADQEIAYMVCSCIEVGEKIRAIKAIREEYSLGLKEAKDIVDTLHVYMYQNNIVPNTGSVPTAALIPSYSDAHAIYVKLLDAAKRRYGGC